MKLAIRDDPLVSLQFKIFNFYIPIDDGQVVVSDFLSPAALTGGESIRVKYNLGDLLSLSNRTSMVQYVFGDRIYLEVGLATARRAIPGLEFVPYHRTFIDFYPGSLRPKTTADEFTGLIVGIVLVTYAFSLDILIVVLLLLWAFSLCCVGAMDNGKSS
jgi:hypothetical protein